MIIELINSQRGMITQPNRSATGKEGIALSDRKIARVNVMRLHFAVVKTISADQLAENATGLVFHSLGDLDINSDVGRIIYTMISAFAEMERKRILQRCNEGRERAKAEGRHLGRFPNQTLHNEIRRLAAEGMNKHAISKQLGCSRTTVYKVLVVNT
ncbi:recombinase family protein [Thaumasiovibrio subtropicus]|uniref:recombinase family protein n=1 Tax=Thaumasiovibrio subtropicus TaxID=1891207 RepID=UPI0039C9B635